jgi:hypothetical protein
VAGAREVWTGIALSEYAAVSSFAAVVHALAAARAPLDLIGMTSDFLADEVHHVELACRLLMRLGGAAPTTFEHQRLSPPTSPHLTPLQRANELSLRIGCIAETFASATAVPMMKGTRHPLVHAVYETIRCTSSAGSSRSATRLSPTTPSSTSSCRSFATSGSCSPKRISRRCSRR